MAASPIFTGPSVASHLEGGFVYWGTDKHAGKAHDMQEVLDIAPS